MLQFKFNLFFVNISMFILISSYLTYFRQEREAFPLFILLFTWYFASHSITHPTFFLEDEIKDRTILTIIQSRKSVIHVLLLKIAVQIFLDLLKSIPLFLLISLLVPISFPALSQLVLYLFLALLVVIGLYGLGLALASFVFIFSRTANTCLLANEELEHEIRTE